MARDRRRWPALQRHLKLSPNDPLASLMLTLSSFCHYSLTNAMRRPRPLPAAGPAPAARDLVTACPCGSGRGRTRPGRRGQGQPSPKRRAIEPSLSLDSFSRLVAAAPQDLRMRVHRTGLKAAGIVHHQPSQSIDRAR